MSVLIALTIFNLNLSPSFSFGTLFPTGETVDIIKLGGYLKAGTFVGKRLARPGVVFEICHFSFLGSGKTGMNVFGAIPGLELNEKAAGLKIITPSIGIPVYKVYLYHSDIITSSIIVGYCIGVRVNLLNTSCWKSGIEMEYFNFPGDQHSFQFLRLGISLTR